MASKKALQIEIDNLRDALRLMEVSRDLALRSNLRRAKEIHILNCKVEQLRDSLEKQNEQATELHLDNAHLNYTILDQATHANAQSDFIAAQSNYITHLTNR